MKVLHHILKLKKVQTVDQVTAPLTQTFLLQLVLQIIQHLPQRFQMVTVLRGELQVLIQVVISQALLHLRYQERLIVQYQ